MASNKNIFCATNPARMTDALWRVICDCGGELSRLLIFLPSRRAVRTVEKMLVDKTGHAIILPHLVALGEGVDDPEFEDLPTDETVISNMHRIAVLASLLAADANIKNISTALPVARDFITMTDYLENEGVNASEINWDELIDEKYAAHFQNKAALLNILSRALPQYYRGRQTQVQFRNAQLRAWIEHLKASDAYSHVIVCASTASVPATADLMAHIATMPNGRIILSGRISDAHNDFELNTNPYNSEYKFLSRLNMSPSDVIPIDVGASAIEFMNHAFSNNPSRPQNGDAIAHCHLIECARESEEAATVAEIAARAVADKKSVLVITPDAAGNQRIASALDARGISADFSGGTPGTMTPAGRAILNTFDEWIEASSDAFDKIYMDADFNLFDAIVRIVDTRRETLTPEFDLCDDASVQIWRAIWELSQCLNAAGIRLTTSDARAFLADAIAGCTVRRTPNAAADIAVIGTIESRMQTADVVILTGLNDGMFPARGYENAWLPRGLADKIGLPSPDRKVSLQSLDFMNLSCGGEVYWTRSRVSGGVQTTESRFISRVTVRGGKFDRDMGAEILAAVRSRDNIAPRPLNYAPPCPPADWSDLYVTELELLIHNPYAFYARHILRLRPIDDYWAGPDARTFGNLVHGVLEDARDFSPSALVAEMDRRAHEILGHTSVMFHFWHKRFLEIAPVAANFLTENQNAYAEIGGVTSIAGRNVRARADRIWDGGVMDIKTGAAPNKAQLTSGNMPQLPLEAYILQSGGFPFPTTVKSQTPVITFLQLRNNDVRTITYDAQTTAEMIKAAVEKTTEIINIFSAGRAPYEYRETSDKKYQAWDDLARRND